MGQIFVCAGKIEEASESFTRAYQMSCILTGNVSSKGNILLKKLSENTPTNVDQLKFFYDEEIDGEIEHLKENGKYTEAKELEERRERAVSSSGTNMDIDDDDDL